MILKEIIKILPKIKSLNINKLQIYATTPVIARDEAAITTDGFRLERILINLISNAIKFTLEGSITLRTWLENNTLCLCVKDTGIGIPKNQQDIIFDIFVRLTISDSSPFEGQGLGLNLVKRFVDDLSGKISVESEENEGSAFTIRLPMAEIAQEVV